MKLTRLIPAFFLTAALAFAAATVHFKGKVLNVADGKMAIETADGNVITLFVKATSHFVDKGKTIALGQLRENDTLEVDATQDAKGSFIIIEARIVVRTDVDEEAAPKLQRGARAAAAAANAPRTIAQPPPEAAPAGNTVQRTTPHELGGIEDRPEFSAKEIAAMGSRRPSGDPKMELINRAAEIAGEFTEKLPNYVCSQYTTRYVSTTRPLNWQSQDVVSASVLYEDGHETYKNIAINGRAQNKTMAELGGSTSSGEFGTVLINLFHPSTQADFKYIQESVRSSLTMAVYDFTVKKQNSNWEIHAESGAMVMPAYTGSVWIDTQKARVMKIVMAAQMPGDFPIDTVETEVDYDYVNLGTERFLLPTRSESISCQRGTVYCSRNIIEWRNYHKYLGESKIIFDPKE